MSNLAVVSEKQRFLGPKSCSPPKSSRFLGAMENRKPLLFFFWCDLSKEKRPHCGLDGDGDACDKRLRRRFAIAICGALPDPPFLPFLNFLVFFSFAIFFAFWGVFPFPRILKIWFAEKSLLSWRYFLGFCQETEWPRIARYCDTIAAIPHIARYFLTEVSIPPKWCDTPPWHFVSHRHICAIPDFATYRAIIVRYPIKTSTKNVCNTIPTSIARYEKYRCWASKPRKQGKGDVGALRS